MALVAAAFDIVIFLTRNLFFAIMSGKRPLQVAFADASEEDEDEQECGEAILDLGPSRLSDLMDYARRTLLYVLSTDWGENFLANVKRGYVLKLAYAGLSAEITAFLLC